MDLDKRKLIVFGSSSDIATEFINNQNELKIFMPFHVIKQNTAK